ncbi:2OG-Fe(II) oxygenase [Rhodovastum atsumiense]|uniref:2OG-Fe(II) oxygenase n=1 Tax=Rhodovastum atsumiense TaxID=504468 RepID=A0A5M6IJL1_9PROT|nr:2OG-Fe(II) oxygenase [Rhodovastum atsumiense]KAA5608454.1 2OG-Fe(II) oxygenase [Rhodovastum atsumiense]CAH2604635.1 2OG-Fe(II) oxygenase [Rhodovastum atsumiense]
MYPPVPRLDTVVHHFVAALHKSHQAEWPYRHWRLSNVFPVDLCTGILTLPIAPPALGVTDGTRGSYNDRRTFFTPRLLEKFPSCAVLAEALQQPEVARLLAETLHADLAGGYLRIEYIQDTDGAWLEPHRDIPEKLFSMVVYLFTGPDAAEWGTDIYDADRRWVARSSGEFNSGVIFIAGPDTWHGFERRQIIGVRRLMEVNYVRPSWRDRDQLCFPDRPVSLA